MPTRENNRKIRDIIEVAQNTRLEFAAQIVLMFFAGAVAWAATGLDFIPVWFLVHYGLVALERWIVWRLRDSNSATDLIIILVAHVLIALTFAAMPVYLWILGGDVYQFAGLVLLMGATLNTFLVRSQLWYQALCFAGPNSLAIAIIAVSVAMNADNLAGSIAILVIGGSLIVYIMVAIYQAYGAHKLHLETREKLAQSQKMEALGNLAGGMAHDFNNILNVITGTVELLRSENDLAVVKGRLARVEDAANRGASLIRQVLSFARKSHLQPDRIEPRRVIDEVENMTQRLITERVTIAYSCDPDLPRVRVDEGALITALLNLVLNARDAIEGPGRIDVRCMLTTPGPANTLARVVFSVRDSGSGIPAEIIDKVTDPFFTTKRKGEGTGLGLSMVAGFAAQSGGELKISSEEGFGTHVQIILPIDEGTADEVEEAAAPSKPAARAHSILVVEDQRELLELLIMFLQRAGHEVRGANSGDAALALLDQGLAPQILISDVVMPGRVQGRELARIVGDRLPGTRIILMSGFDESEFDQGPPVPEGVTQLMKPVKLADLSVLIQQG